MSHSVQQIERKQKSEKHSERKYEEREDLEKITIV